MLLIIEHFLLLISLIYFQLELDGKVGCLHLLLSPNQITNLTDLLTALCIETGNMLTLYDFNVTKMEKHFEVQLIHNITLECDLY